VHPATRAVSCWVLSAAAGAASAGWAFAAAPIDMASVRAAAGPAVCRIVPETSWGIPAAFATGFVLGDGRFVVTDLGSVGRPGVVLAMLTFQDGSKAAAREFGMADPAVGVALLRLPETGPKRAGLSLAAALPALDGTATVAAAGWQWGSQLEFVTGRLWKGPAIREFAALAHVEPPAGADVFVRMDGGRMEGGPGSPVLDASGTVLAMGFELVVRDTVAPLGMPATALRGALLSAQPQLRPLAELPKPLWSTRVLRMPGPPAATADLAGAVNRFKAALTCQMCKGTGQVVAPWRGGGIISQFFDAKIPCPDCRGELAVISEGALKTLVSLAEQGTRTVWAPGGDDRARASARAAATEMLRSVTGYGPHFRGDLARLVGAALNTGTVPMPCGIVCQAQLSGTADGPDGRYIFLSPWRSQATLAVRAEDLAAPGYKTGVRREPPPDSWIVLVGAVLSRFKGESREGFYVLPCEWLPYSPPPQPDPDDRRPPFDFRRRGQNP